MDMSYEEYFYDNYLPKIAAAAAEPSGVSSIPPKQEYLQQIHSTAPKCMMAYKEKYKENPDFYKKTNEITRESIQSFLEMANLDKTKLTEYLQKTQSKKIYMLYFQGVFNIETEPSALNHKSFKKKYKNKPIRKHIWTTRHT